MSLITTGLFNFDDRLHAETLNQRLMRHQVITANVANAETPGFRALGYGFEEQLKGLANANEPLAVKTSNEKHLKNPYTRVDGRVYPDVFIKPTESIPHDGNTVDMDREMAELAQNQILYRSAVELLNRKIGLLRYAITNGGR